MGSGWSPSITLAFALVLSLVCGSSALAQTTVGFTGSYSLFNPSPGAGTFTSSSGVSSLGAWSAQFTNPAGDAEPSITTNSSNQTLAFSASVLGELFGDTADVRLTTTAAASGTVTFDLSYSNFSNASTGTTSSAGIYVFVNNTLVTSYTNISFGTTFAAQSFDVVSGNTIEFRATAYATATSGFPSGTQAWGNVDATFSNVSFPDVAAIPEPATYASALAVVALGFGVVRRRRATMRDVPADAPRQVI